MNDYLQLKDVFLKFDLDYRASFENAEMQIVLCADDHDPKCEGEYNFSCTFNFDSDGKFIKADIEKGEYNV